MLTPHLIYADAHHAVGVATGTKAVRLTTTSHVTDLSYAKLQELIEALQAAQRELGKHAAGHYQAMAVVAKAMVGDGK